MPRPLVLLTTGNLPISDNSAFGRPFADGQHDAILHGVQSAQAEGAGAKVRSEFADSIPPRPYCCNEIGPLSIRPRDAALGYRHVQLNRPGAISWLTFDIDRPGAYFASADANLPPENIVIVNPENGHAHGIYRLAQPVATHNAARMRPLRFAAAVQRGMVRRLDADRFYVGLIAKNPLHPDWIVEWRRHDPYHLDELNDWLFDTDKSFDPRPAEPCGLGRNCSTFDQLRLFAYREVRKFKSARADLDAFRARLESVALGINRQFVHPMAFGEVRAIARSVAKWTWQRFSDDRFSEIQRWRSRRANVKRWADRVAGDPEPWIGMGISRSTYYRNTANGWRPDIGADPRRA